MSDPAPCPECDRLRDVNASLLSALTLVGEQPIHLTYGVWRVINDAIEKAKGARP